MKKRLMALIVLLAIAHAALAVDAVSLLSGGITPASTDAAPQAAADDAVALYEPKADAEACTARGEELSRLLDDWNTLKADDAAKRFGVTAEDVTRRVVTLTELKNSYPGIINALGRKKQLDAGLAQQKSDASAPELNLTEKPPYRLRFYDVYINELDILSQQIDDMEEGLQRAARYVEATQKLIDEREAAWRLARDNAVREQTAANVWALQEAALLLESARAQNLASRLLRENSAAHLAASKLKYQRQSNVRNYIRDNIDLDEDSFAAQLAELNAYVKKLEASRPELLRQFKQAIDEAESAVLAWAATKDEAEKAVAALRRDMCFAERERCRYLLEHLQGMLIVHSARRRIWALRYDIARGSTDKSKITDILQELETESKTLDENLAGVQKDLLSLQNRHSAIQKQIYAAGIDSNVLAILRRHLTALQGSIDSCLAYITDLYGISAQERAFIEELQHAYKTVSVWDKAVIWWQKKGAKLLNTELWQSGGYAVRLREFLIALALIVLGTWAARRSIYMLVWLASRRSGMDEATRRYFCRLFFCAASIAIFLGALRIVGIPLTAFAFLGGALAIAFGFGTQNLFKNIVSGILLTLKRPFRIGNIIEVGGFTGTVSDIGVSSTVIRTFDEKEVVIPNSELLEKLLVNWGLSDLTQRRCVEVGVEYGTPPELVRETMLATLAPLQKDDLVLKAPEPWVEFAQFGDSALHFTLYFWINQRRIVGPRVESAVREAIVAAFNKAGIAFAYPHMDIDFPKYAPIQPGKTMDN